MSVRNLQISTKTLDLSGEDMNLLLADSYFSVGYEVYIKAQKELSTGSVQEKVANSGSLFVGAFNLAHGFELLLKTLLQSLHLMDKGKQHKFQSGLRALIEMEPVIAHNIDMLGATSEEVFDALSSLEECYHKGRYFGVGNKKTRNTSFPSPKSIAIIVIALAVAFPKPIMNLSYLASIAKMGSKE
ncbi:hypothetical protein [Halocynthiibacter sp.]|uniref:hypothetical protein n=1 Tax=Halocynthiibacter sp. TaxID=1979210 RepID=UPI003C38D777